MSKEEFATDPLADISKIAQKIASQAQQVGARVDIKIVGCLHAGEVREEFNGLLNADLVTLELPSHVVRVERAGNPTALQKRNSFWWQLLNKSDNAVGVNNNFAAVWGRRLMMGQIIEGLRYQPKGLPLIISTRREFLDQFTDQAIDSTHPVEIEVTEPKTLDYIRNINEGVKEFPFSLQDKYGLYHLLTPLATGPLRALICLQPWISPLGFLLAQKEQAVQHEPDLPESFLLYQEAIQHFIRVKVDKTQVKGMLKGLGRLLKGHKERYQVVHFGGFDHDENLVELLSSVFADYDHISVSEEIDPRIVKPKLTMRNFFARNVPVSEALSAGGVFGDFFCVDAQRANQLISQTLKGAKHDLERLTYMEKYKDRYTEDSQDSVDFDVLALEYLLSLLPAVVLRQNESGLMSLTEAPLEKLFYFVGSLVPEKGAEVEKAYRLFKERSQHFPKS